MVLGCKGEGVRSLLIRIGGERDAEGRERVNGDRGRAPCVRVIGDS